MGRAMRRYADWALHENMRNYDFYMRRFERILFTMFDWQGLPDGISKRFVEEQLYYNGIVIFFKSKKYGFYMITKATPISLNTYGEPTGYHAITLDGKSEIVSADDCVPIWNDYFRRGNVSNCSFFAKKLENIERTFDLNLEQMKNPYIIGCPEGQRETVKAMYAKKEAGEPLILVSDAMAVMNDLKVFNLDVKNYTTELMDVKHDVINDALTFFGINNVNVRKKERLVTGEAEQNDEQILLSKNAMYKARREAAEAINAKFGTDGVDISVSLSKDFYNELDKTIAEMTGGAANE